MRRFLVKIRLLLLFGFCLGLIPMSLSCYSSEEAENGDSSLDTPEKIINSGSEKSNTVTCVPSLSYSYGNQAVTEAYNSGSYSYLLSEYNTWKSNYVTSSGAGGYLRVKRDAATNYDTVSEGIGYGMLLAVYYNDQKTFDNLYGYAMLHAAADPAKVSSNVYSVRGYGLMHWLVDANGNNATEFTSDETGTYMKVGHGAVSIQLSTALNTYPKFPVYVETSQLTTTGILKTHSSAEYAPAGGARGSISTATDADSDIITALIFASKTWRTFKYYTPNSTYNSSKLYTTEAVAWLKAFLDNDVKNYDSTATTATANSVGCYLRAGNLWGLRDFGWNPSYFCPAYYTLWSKFLKDQGVSSTYYNSPTYLKTVMYNELAKIYSGSGVKLCPDWVCTATGSPAKSTLSDRWYYLDKNGDGVINTSDYNTTGTALTKADAVGMMSYNFYYDAVRVPWRIALDYSWNGGNSTQNTVLSRMNSFFASRIRYGTLCDGYSITGGVWNKDDRDGFNNLTAGKYGGEAATNPSYNSVTFYAMCAAPIFAKAYSISYGTGNYVDPIKNGAISTGETYHYYGNTARLLSLTYLYGRMTNLYNCQIALKSVSTGCYVCADSDADPTNAQLVANRSARDAWETFDIIDLGNNKVALRCHNGNVNYRYVCADFNVATKPPIYANRDAVGAYETFTASYLGSNTITLLSCNGTYVSVNSSTKKLTASATSVTDAEKFSVTYVP